MATVNPPRATVDDLYRTEGKAELIGGRIVEYPMNGFLPGRVAINIVVSLRAHARSTGRGVATADGVGYTVPELSSGRESFGPDAAYYDGPMPPNLMKFIDGPPTFAVEVRSENDYGPAANAEYVAKRVDYFAAGTKAVWDVGPVNETVAHYRDGDAANPAAVFRRGDTADAEPAVPGWRIAVDEIFA